MNANTSVQEVAIRVPKNSKKRYSVMNFHTSANVDVSKWSNVQMERENKMENSNSSGEQAPKFGAGSEFGRERREEARRNKYGKRKTEYDPDAQPWILKADGKGGKTLRGTKQGGINENSDYYVFIQASDGAFEAYPIEDWYNFQTVPKYKPLDAEQAEAAFEKRDAVLNYFQVMKKKKEVDDEALDGVKGGAKVGRGERGRRELKISDGKEFGRSSGDDSDEDGVAEPKKVATTKKKKVEKVKKEQVDVESDGGESGGDGHAEGIEVDYFSGSGSDSDPTKNVEDEGTDESSDEEKEENVFEKTSKAPEAVSVKAVNSSTSGSSSSGSESDDFDDDGFKSALFVPQTKTERENASSEPKKKKKKDKSDVPVPIHVAAPKTKTGRGRKRKEATTPPKTKAKKPKMARDEVDVGVVTAAPLRQPSEVESLESMVRRLLERKPMTTTEVLKSVKAVRNMAKEQYVKVLAEIIKRIKPEQKMVGGKMHLFLKKN